MIFIAYRTVPYNSDSLNYHLTRIMQWVQNSNVAHYSTSSVRELTSPPFAEFINLHVFLLSDKSYQLFNLLQCVSFIYCVCLVYAIARKIECSKSFSIVAAFMCLSMPIGLAEAFSTQVDDFATVWLLIFVYYIIDYFKTTPLKFWSSENIFRLAILGACFGIGYLTKPSVCIIMLCFALVLAVIYLRNTKLRLTLLKSATFIVIVAIILMLPEMMRNINSFGSISDPVAGNRQMVGTLNPLYVFMNFFKNLIFNLPTQLFPFLNEYLDTLVRNVSALLHVDLNNPAISEDGWNYLLYTAPNYHHDRAINPLIVWSFLICTILGMITCIAKRKNIIFTPYTISTVLSFIFLMAIIRWEEFETRYEIALLAILCPYISYVLSRVTENVRKQEMFSGAYLGICSLLALMNLAGGLHYHSILTEYTEDHINEQYFYSRGNAQPGFLEALEIIEENDYEKIGLVGNETRFAYPLWPMLADDEVEIRDVLVENASSQYDERNFVPDIVLASNDSVAGDLVTINGSTYEKTPSDNGYFSIYEKLE